MMIAQAYFESYGVETEGIFRVSAEKPVLDELVSKFDDGSPVDVSSYAESAHTMAGLLKRYFREMPEPLIPFDLYDPFLKAVESGESEMRALRLQKMVALLSRPRYATLQALMEILVAVASKRHVNKMGAENLAVVFAPTLFRPKGDNLSQSMNDTPLTTACVVLMIDYFDRIFPAAAAAKKQPPRPSSPGPELFVPQPLPVPTLPPLPESQRPRRGSITLDNAQLGSFLAKKAAASSAPSAEEMRALIGLKVWAQYAVDGRWYPAVVESFAQQEGLLVVAFSDYGNRQYSRRDQITFSDPNIAPPASPPCPPPNVAPVSPQLPVRSQTPPPSLVTAPPRKDVAVRPLAPARSNTVMTRSTPSIAPVAPRPRPPIAPRQSDSQLADQVSVAASAAPPISPRSMMQRAQTVLPVQPRKSDTPIGSRPAPAPRPNPVSGSFAAIPTAPARSVEPQPVRLPPAAAPPLPTVDQLPPLPQLPPASAIPQHIVPSPRIESYSAPASVIEYSANDVEAEDDMEDYTMSADMPILPPKPEKILSQMKEIAQLQQSEVASLPPLGLVEEGVVVAVDANSLVSSAPPPMYAEFDDE